MLETPESIQPCLKFIEHYTDLVRGVYKDVGAGADVESSELVLVLRIFHSDLRRRLKNLPVSLDWLSSLNHAGRISANLLESLCTLEAEALGDWQLGDEAQNDQQGLAGILVIVIRDLYKVITATEKLYPERAEEFEAERIGYYELKRAVQEADSLE